MLQSSGVNGSMTSADSLRGIAAGGENDRKRRSSMIIVVIRLSLRFARDHDIIPIFIQSQRRTGCSKSCSRQGPVFLFSIEIAIRTDDAN